ncbi:MULTISPECIES: hypothetical protein [unclassified Brevundimonas]|uniref:hypothetical protein n=1 Tax=unclassified Brevundimonas TaxID=2622653 RepID=UPI0020034B75|nr:MULTISPECIES: hypothetical protein [unclassified Brevundimonas]MCK6102897.1 hypothetical protein [Brevundimonas sp. EYE_349]
MLVDDEIDLLAPPIDPVSAPLSGIGEALRTVEPSAPSTLSEGWISEAEFSALIGVTSRRVRDLVRDGVLHKTTRNRRLGFLLPDEVQSYCKHLRERAVAQGQTDELKIERVRKERAAAEKIELQNAALRGELVSVAAVKQEWGGVVRDVRAGMLAVSARVGAVLPALTPHDISIIDREIHSALEGMADDK